MNMSDNAQAQTVAMWWSVNFRRFPIFSWEDVENHARYCADLQDLAERLNRKMED